MGIFSLTEALLTSQWQKFDEFRDPTLQQLVKEIPLFLQKSKRPATIKAYTGAYKTFERWASDFNELLVYPTNEYAISLYLIHMVQEAKSTSAIRQFIASVSWFHQLGGFSDPSKRTVVVSILDSAYKQLSKPVQHKLPVTKDILSDIHDSMFEESDEWNLACLRDFSYILLSFSGFLRYDEAANVKRNHLHIMHDYMILDIPRSKTDPMCHGDQVYIVRSSTLTWLVRYLKAAGIKNEDDCYIFRGVFHQSRSNEWGLRRQNKPLSYTALSEMFQKRLRNIGQEEGGYSLHSLRAGGVTLAAAAGVAEKMYKAHGRWRSEAVKSYVKESVASKLSVTSALAL